MTEQQQPQIHVNQTDQSNQYQLSEEDQQFHELVKRTLYPTQVIKNNKHLCKLLNLEEKKGNSKKAQEKHLLRFFNFEKEKQKYIITKIYDYPLPKDDQRIQGNNSIYTKHIELLLLNHLSKQEGYKTTITLKKLFLLLGMINHKYIEENKEEMKANSEYINDYQINHFYQRTYQKLRKVIFDTLNNLKNRCLIHYEEVIMISINELIFDKIETITRTATDSEKNIIKDIKKEVLQNMGLESITLVFLKFKSTEFYLRVNELLKERYDINYTYTDIKILFTKKHIIEALQQAELLIQKKMLNDKIIDAVNKQAQHIYDKNQIEYNEQVEEFMKHFIGEPNRMVLNKFFKLNDVYLYAQEELAEMLLRYY